MKKQTVIISIVLVSFAALGFNAYDNVYLKINQNIDIFGRVYKEIVNNYVDEVDPEKFMRSGIEGMLETLDPYTVFMAGREEDDIDLLTHGQYGGVGISIGVRDGVITVLAPTEGYSAFKQGVKAGDKIIEVDGVAITTMNPDSVRFKVRGEPGTTVRMIIEREGEKKPIEFTLVREEIQVNNVSYSGFITNNVGYIRLDRFSRRAGEEVRQAIKELKAKGDLKGIVLDLRDNPGGLLEAAVEIVSKFAPKGSTIVTTRGRKGVEERTYKVEEEPIAADLPLAIVMNKNSASASEIVAGAVQDLDRGIIVGTRSFGKGLVQTVIPLNYSASMKITTARYYIPSGRSIQEIDYLHKNKDGVFAITPDSLKREFRTLRGRIVKELGGLSPDSTVEDVRRSDYYVELMRKAMFFKFATTFVSKHPDYGGDVTVTADVMKEFEQYLNDQKFEFVEPAEKKLTDLRDQMKKEKYSSTSVSGIETLITQIHSEKKNAFFRYNDEIKYELSEELNSRYNGEKGRARIALTYDVQAQTAASLLLDKMAYEGMLKLKK
ncbi:MAG: S41 family peptidase [Bacteriovoracaceae bacterium]|nr:S41 family peptidase [Bacteroidota bacterium]